MAEVPAEEIEDGTLFWPFGYYRWAPKRDIEPSDISKVGISNIEVDESSPPQFWGMHLMSQPALITYSNGVAYQGYQITITLEEAYFNPGAVKNLFTMSKALERYSSQQLLLSNIRMEAPALIVGELPRDSRNFERNLIERLGRLEEK
jgi:hypothetical protein